MFVEMNETDLDLLNRYTRHHAEEAFAEIVRRHLDLVYSAALRQVRSPQLAEEVAQSAFTDLAHQAHRLAPDTILTAWLHQVTRRTAIEVVRREARRHLREQIATEMNTLNASAADWSHIEPLLDEAVQALDETDRAAVLLRYFENQSLREVGQTLGISEDAAQKRVSRAVERLRDFFAKRDVTVGASGLAVAITANAVQAAPAGLAATISSAAALAGTAISTSTALAATKAIAMTTIQKAIVGATLVVAVGTGIYQARRASNLGEQVRTLRQQQGPLVEQIAQLRSGSEGLSNQLAQANGSRSLSTARLRELLRLRAEVGMLRRQQRELERAGAAAQSKSREPSSGGSLSGSRPANQPRPFQLQLVRDEPGDDTEAITNNASGSGGETLHVQKTPLLDYTAVSSATVTMNASSGAPEINVEFSQEGKELFAAVTRENLNQRVAIVLDGHLYAAPVIRSEISGGKAQITGAFTVDEANALAAKINEAVGGP
jgi:RNA polymerase sigma factor (sigma-70 family)